MTSMKSTEVYRISKVSIRVYGKLPHLLNRDLSPRLYSYVANVDY